jgi:hypothetical protein
VDSFKGRSHLKKSGESREKNVIYLSVLYSEGYVAANGRKFDE